MEPGLSGRRPAAYFLRPGAAGCAGPGGAAAVTLMAAASFFNAIGDIVALFEQRIGATHFGYF